MVAGVPNTDAKGNVSYGPVLAYCTTGGRTLQAQAGQVCQGSPFAPGQAMSLRYQNDTRSPSASTACWGSGATPFGCSASAS